MFANFPKLVDRNFVIGFLLPVMIGLIGLAWLFPSEAFLAPLLSSSANEETLGKLTYLLITAYGLAILLVATNAVQDRILQGYEPPLKWLTSLAAYHERRRAAGWDEVANLNALEDSRGEHFTAEMAADRNQQWRRLVNSYPPLRLAIMPTRYGNVTRAFESYAFDVYGADAPPAWSRLTTVLPKDVRTTIEDARGRVNLFLNLVYILSALAVTGLAHCIATTPWRSILSDFADGRLDQWQVMPALWVSAGLALLVYPSYHLAVTTAQSWGEQVKAAFDLYLPALVKQLGYAQPRSEAERRALWRELNALFVYWEPINDTMCRFAPNAGGDRAPSAAEGGGGENDGDD